MDKGFEPPKTILVFTLNGNFKPPTFHIVSLKNKVIKDKVIILYKNAPILVKFRQTYILYMHHFGSLQLAC